jgi:hypothetical protein
MLEHEAMASERSSSTAASKPCSRILPRTRLRFTRFFYIPFAWQRPASINELLLLQVPIQRNCLFTGVCRLGRAVLRLAAIQLGIFAQVKCSTPTGG